MRRVLVLLVLVAGLAVVGPSGAASDDVITEQTVTPVAPAEEQQVVAIAAPEQQQIQAVVVDGTQIIGPNVPPTEADRAASTAGKVVLGVASAALSLGVTAAMLMFL